MTDKEFKRLRRDELIDIIYALQQSEKALQEENESLRRRLSEREIKINNSGSIAEAALALNGVFEAAQSAADQYLEQVRQNNDKYQAEVRAQAAAILEQAQTECDEMRRQAEADCERIRAKADEILELHESVRVILEQPQA